MISEAELRNVLQSNNFLPIRYLNNDNYRRLFVLDISLDEYIDFIKFKKAEVVFYKFFFYDYKKFLITDETIESIDVELNDELKRKISNYNDNIKSRDFERPYKLTCFIESETGCYSIDIDEKWLEEQEKINDPEIALISLVNSYETDDPDEIYNSYISEESEKLSALILESKKKLIEFLLNDNKFKMCTNQSLRNSYAITLEESRPDLMASFYGKNGRYEVHRAYSAFEIIYKCIKTGITDTNELLELI